MTGGRSDGELTGLTSGEERPSVLRGDRLALER